jgi:predicted metal-dependent HD superfamily phosphohydrolase
MSSPSDSAWLHAQWLELCRKLGIDRLAAEEAFADLAQRYGEPHRAYHQLRHLRQVLETIQDLSASQSGVAVQLAAWFHDVIYDPRATDNEERSAEHAERVLRRFNIDDELIRRVRELILLTRTHVPSPNDSDALLLLDADLAILGARPEEYDAYAASIRQEYAHVSHEDFRRGRAAVLERFLHRPRIYQTEALAREREERARANLRRELERLTRQD